MPGRLLQGFENSWTAFPTTRRRANRSVNSIAAGTGSSFAVMCGNALKLFKQKTNKQKNVTENNLKRLTPTQTNK